MYLKQRDKDILNWLENVSSINDKDGVNNKIIGNIFYNDCKDPYYNSSRRLKELYRSKFLKRYRKNINDEYIYYRSRPLSEHQIKLLEVYSKFCTLGNVTLFEREVEVVGGNKKRKNDGLIIIEIEKEGYLYEYPIIIEIDKTHDTGSDKINDLYRSSHYQNRFGIMPMMLIVKRNEFQKRIYVKDVNLVYVNWDLEGISLELFNE